MDDYLASNRRLWDAWTDLHVASETYDLAAFRAGRDPLEPEELAEIGDVRGRSLLHLQCHFGKETLAGRATAPPSPGSTSPRARSPWPGDWPPSSTCPPPSCARLAAGPAPLGAGLRIGALREYEHLAWRFFPWMVTADDIGRYKLPDGTPRLPLSFFSLRAVKD